MLKRLRYQEHMMEIFALESPHTMGIPKGMVNLEEKYDHHIWIKEQTSNINFSRVCRQSLCVRILNA